MKNSFMKIIASYLAIAMFVIGIVPRVYAGFLPSEALVLNGFDRAADLRIIQKALEQKIVQNRLAVLGFSQEEIQQRLPQLTDEQIHSLAQNIDQLNVGRGGQYGQGALQIAGKTVDYYSLAAGSLGYQIGAEQYDLVILFMTNKALTEFRNSQGWEAGVDGEVTVVQVGADVSVATLRSQNPIAGFVFDQKGLMAGISVRGAKFTKIFPE